MYYIYIKFSLHLHIYLQINFKNTFQNVNQLLKVVKSLIFLIRSIERVLLCTFLYSILLNLSVSRANLEHFVF